VWAVLQSMSWVRAEWWLLFFLWVPIRSFYATQSFFSSDLFRFWSLGSGWRGLSCTKFGGDWSSGSGVKRGHR